MYNRFFIYRRWVLALFTLAWLLTIKILLNTPLRNLQEITETGNGNSINVINYLIAFFLIVLFLYR